MSNGKIVKVNSRSKAKFPTNGNAETGLGANSVATVNLQDLSVTTPKLQDASVTPVKLASNALFRVPTSSIDTNYTILDADRVLLFTPTASRAAILPTAVGRSGQEYEIRKTNSNAFTVSIATTSSQTVGGRASNDVILRAIDDFIIVYSDGANWQIRNKKETDIRTGSSGKALGGLSNNVDIYHALPGDTNGLTLTKGQWKITHYYRLKCQVTTDGGVISGTSGLYSTTGANNTTQPSTTFANATIRGFRTLIEAFPGNATIGVLTGIASNTYFAVSMVSYIDVFASQNVYAILATNTTGNTANSDVSASIVAERIW